MIAVESRSRKKKLSPHGLYLVKSLAKNASYTEIYVILLYCEMKDHISHANTPSHSYHATTRVSLATK